MGIVCACLLALLVAAPLSAQGDPPAQFNQGDLALSTSLGIEANGYPRGGIGFGGLFMLDLQWSPAFAAGLKGSYNTDFDEYTAGDGMALFRWYFFQSFMPSARKVNFFVQAEGGIIFQREPIATDKHGPGEVVLGGGGGLVVGARISLKPNLYVEPYARAGYPWLWGAGVLAGYTFYFANKNGSSRRGTQDGNIIVVNSETFQRRLGI